MQKAPPFWCPVSIICRCFITKEQNFFALVLQGYLFQGLQIDTAYINIKNTKLLKIFLVRYMVCSIKIEFSTP